MVLKGLIGQYPFTGQLRVYRDVKICFETCVVTVISQVAKSLFFY